MQDKDDWISFAKELMKEIRELSFENGKKTGEIINLSAKNASLNSELGRMDAQLFAVQSELRALKKVYAPDHQTSQETVDLRKTCFVHVEAVNG